MSTKIRRGVLATVAAAAVAGSLLTVASPAQAAWGSPGGRYTVCAVDLAVRDAPAGTPFNTLTTGQTFQIDFVSGSWARGFAYGNVNANGWVENGWFC
ncbi:MAG: hypothetical protein WCA46_23865 [Actinocatenispora sp.]